MNWKPFDVVPPEHKADLPRSLDTPEGVGDRLRSAAFAEFQAREAFLWASTHFTDAPEDLKKAWVELAEAEDRHMGWLLKRMEELGYDVAGRRVSDQLWISLMRCKSAKDFALYMANAEERGRKAGLRFYEGLLKTDPITAEIFGKIAEEEVAHIALASKFF